MQNFIVTLQQATEQLQQEPKNKFTVVMQQREMKVEYFAPHKIDTQTPHKQDELYIIAKGSGSFYRDGEMVNFNTGDVIFVPAGMPHHFENFTPDFATWVIFYGSEYGHQNYPAVHNSIH
jgi:mannose-6-phosphate isomerase-like protein (cupin superfamily)